MQCKSRQEIDDYFRDEVFNFAFINTYFAADDYDNTIKTFIDDQLFFEIDPTVTKKANFFIMNQEAGLEDDILQFGQSKELNFHQVSNIKSYENDYVDSEGFVVAVYIRADKFYDSYERKVTDILTLLGDLGGLQEFFIMIGGLLVNFLA